MKSCFLEALYYPEETSIQKIGLWMICLFLKNIKMELQYPASQLLILRKRLFEKLGFLEKDFSKKRLSSIRFLGLAINTLQGVNL